MRDTIKGFVEQILISSGATYFSRRGMSERVLILAYHNVVPNDDPPFGDLANHLPFSKFAEQVSALGETHDVVPLADVFSPASHRSGRPRAVVTFDDAYRGAVLLALPELVRQGMPATVFVAPAFVGGGSYWWDALAKPGGGGLDPAVRDHALITLRGEDAAVRDWAGRTGQAIADVPEVGSVASEAELSVAANLPGISIGSHTWSHPNLTRLTSDEVQIELTKPLLWLAEHVTRPVRWLAYPYGFFDQSVARAAASVGYEAALAVSGGWVPSTPEDRFALPRVNIPRGLSKRGFTLRGAGLLT